MSDFRCLVCDGINYYIDSGFFYCKECHSQSQAHQETECEFGEFNSKCGTSKNKKNTNTKPIALNKQWTSWEGFNVILKGQVDELIALGADPRLKIVVLQIWSKYLNKLEAAFTSTSEHLLPKFSLNQYHKDYEIIYGISREKKKPRLKSRNVKTKKRDEVSIDASTSYSEKRSINKLKRAVTQAEYEHVQEELASTQDMLSQVDDYLKKRNISAKQNNSLADVQFSKEALRLSQTRRKYNEEEEDEGEDDEVDVEQVEKFSKKLDYNNPYCLSRAKLLAVLVLALNLINSQIQISDLLRWINEGHLSYTSVSHLFPETMSISKTDTMCRVYRGVPSYKSLSLSCVSLAKLVQVDAFKTPDLLALAQRYVVELQLPRETMVHVRQLVQLSVCQVPLHSVHMLNYEGLAMAYVIMAVKMCFGLDGVTERRISRVATLINSLLPQQSQCEEFFVWEDWVRYIECRKAVIVHHHFPSRSGQDISIDTSVNPYLHVLQDKESKTSNKQRPEEQDASVLELQSSRGQVVTNMKWSVNQLPVYEENEDPAIQFPISLTPNCTYLKTIATRNILNKVLRQDFTKTSYQYLIQPERIVKFARLNGYNIQVSHSRATLREELVPSHNFKMNLRSTVNQLVQVKFLSQDTPSAPDNFKSPPLKKQRTNRHVEVESSSDWALVNNIHLKPTKIRTDIEKTQVLYIPFSDYWLLDCAGIEVGNCQEFESKVAINFPDSFGWLLNECSRMLQMTSKDLYGQLLSVEKMYRQRALPNSMKVIR